MTITRSLLGLNRPQTIPAADIARVEVRTGMQVGRTQYYDLWMLRTKGSSLPAGGLFRQKNHADRIAGEMEKCLLSPRSKRSSGQ